MTAFPVNPTCTLTWFIRGGIEWFRFGSAEPPVFAPPGVLFSGPSTVPSFTGGHGAPEAFMCLLMPDALHAIGGLDVSAWVNRLAPVEQALGAEWVAMSRSVLAAPDDAARVQRVEAFLAPRLASARRAGLPGVGRYDAWSRGLIMRAQRSGMGRGVRQIERRVKQWCGVPARDLQSIARAEALYLRARQAWQEGRLEWAAMAAESGFADQSHLCRATQRATGVSPTELQRRVESDESYWVYRLWR